MAFDEVSRPDIRKESNGDISIVSGFALFQAMAEHGRCVLALNDGRGVYDSECGVVSASVTLDAGSLDALIAALREIRSRLGP